jgi:hypothetical protein
MTKLRTIAAAAHRSGRGLPARFDQPVSDREIRDLAVMHRCALGLAPQDLFGSVRKC